MEAKSISPYQTQKIAEKLSRSLKNGDIVALFGRLGAGKTVFIKGLAKGLGIKQNIISPTFIFMRSYPIILRSHQSILHHLDLYRGNSKQDFRHLGLDEIFNDKSIVVLEWADKIEKSLPNNRINVNIDYINERTRRITISRN